MKANLVARLKQRLIGKNKKNTFDMLPYTVEELKKTYRVYVSTRNDLGKLW